jgi:hypothetical protein
MAKKAVAMVEVAQKEVADKVAEEEWKKDVETRNDAQLMDTDIPEISTTSVNRHTKFIELGLGLCTLFRPSEVPNLNKFTYNKLSGKIVQE